jgi:hypothetical protein
MHIQQQTKLKATRTRTKVKLKAAECYEIKKVLLILPQTFIFIKLLISLKMFCL